MEAILTAICTLVATLKSRLTSSDVRTIVTYHTEVKYNNIKVQLRNVTAVIIPCEHTSSLQPQTLSINQSPQFLKPPVYSPCDYRFRNNSVDEVFRIDNTNNYESKSVGNATLFKAHNDGGDIVGIAGEHSTPGEFVDEKGIYTAVAPINGTSIQQ